MIEKKVEPEKQAEPRQTSGPGSTTQEDVVKLLASILNQVQRQVQSTTPKALLEGAVLQAVEQFREISAALVLQPPPKITLTADPSSFGVNGGAAKLTWSSTDAQTVSIVGVEKPVGGGGAVRDIGEVKPAAGGFIEIFVGVTTTFTATAKGPCGSATGEATVNVAVLG